MKLLGPIWLMQPIPYLGEELEGEWGYEPKIDGWRMQIVKYGNGEVEFWGRRLEKKPNWTNKLSYLVEVIKEKIPIGTLLDCELFSSAGRAGIASLFAKMRDVKPIVYIFDVVFFEGEFIGNKGLTCRKKLLGNINLVSPFILMPFYMLNERDIKCISPDNTFGSEGIILKKASSKYQVCKDGPIATADWQKIKYGSR